MAKNMKTAKIDRLLLRKTLAEDILERDDLDPCCIKAWEKELEKVDAMLNSIGGK